MRGRTVTYIAIGALGLDGVLLLLAGSRGGRPLMAAAGVACLAAAVAVWLYWRRYRRLIRELRDERLALGREAEELRRILREGGR